MKRVLSVLLLGLFGSLFLFLTSCGGRNNESKVVFPFSSDSNERNLIVVMSDMHLGADITYAECNHNREALEKLLLKTKESEGVKELVIAGDLIDEWFIPATVDAYKGKGQSAFVQRLAETNKGIFDVLNSIIQEGKILVTYVPGNHDLAITKKSIELILPGINQARDSALLGLGTYTPVDCPEVAIEHGHRYNFFCSPDNISNQDIAPGTIMPPGYFFTRIAALTVADKSFNYFNFELKFRDLPLASESQQLLSDYWSFWQWVEKKFPIPEGNDEKVIVTNMNGFTGSYSVNDLLPYHTTPGGIIDVNLYKGIQDNWGERQKQNNVPVYIDTEHAIRQGNSPTETDSLAITQYFQNEKSDKRIVVFGHNHRSNLIASENLKGQKTIYANSGTWIDHNPAGSTANFVVITPQDDSDATAQTFVKVYNFENEIVTEEHSDSVRL